MPKSKKACRHDGDVFPMRGEKSLRRDALMGWAVDVYCGKCNMTGITKVDVRPKVVDWDGKIPDGDDFNYELVRRYGPFKEIGRAREAKLAASDMWKHIFTVKSCEDDDGNYTMHAHVGHGLVNVETIFESTNPMPEDLEVLDFWYDDHLKAP
jgi:hypothetical protein